MRGPLLSMLAAALGVFGAPAAEAWAAGSTEEAQEESLIRDNSFLIEEAYNQEDHVVQEINNLTSLGPERDWTYVFTQEIPIHGMKHQLSYTLTLADPGHEGGKTGLGDSLLNYRYQVAGGGSERLAFAPRISLLLPTGDDEEDRGFGAFGLFFNLPVSVQLSSRWVTHSNAGGAFIPSARNASGDEADVSDYFLGQSAVWLARPNLNVVFEAIYAWSEEVTGPGATERSSSFLLNPGLRWAINRPSGLQIVPGISVPIGVGPSRGDEFLFLYLSFEHPVGK